MNKKSYPRGKSSVKALYTIRKDGKSYLVRASHLEILRILTILFGAGRLK